MELISSKENKQIKQIKKLSSSASFRHKEGLFLAEGLRLCTDALKSGAKVQSAFFSETFARRNPDFTQVARREAGTAYLLKDSIFSAVSDTKTPQGVLFVIKTLDKTIDFDKMKDNGKVLAIENIQDPVNLGTILRSAEALGVDAVVLSRGCCDVYSPKVTRGSMGAVFRLRFAVTDHLPALIHLFNETGTSYAAVLEKGACALPDCDFSGKVLAVVGNEGNGIMSETVSACTHKVYIPMTGGAESLNVSAAASILIWEMTK